MFYSVLDSKGLYTYANQIGQQSPPGSMSVASNVNCDQIGITTSRRGFEFYSDQQFDVTYGPILKLFVYLDTMYASFNDGQFAQDDGSGAWTVYGSSFKMNPPTNGFLHQMLAGGNSYFTTDNGIYKLSGINATAPLPAGAPPALDTQLQVSDKVTSGFLNAQSQCAYEIVWGYTDESELLILGAPSAPEFASNVQSAGSDNNANVTLIFSIPPMVQNNQSLPWFYQIYRTPNTGSLSVPPGNNYQLVAQDDPAAGDFTNHYVTYEDTTLDSLLGASLYTASGQPGVGQPYNQPPLAADVAYFSSMAFYANYSTLHNVFATLIAVGASEGIQAGDVFVMTDQDSLTGYQYTAAASTAGKSVSGVPTSIDATAEAFTVDINGDGPQPIVVDDGGTHTGVHIASVMQAAIRALIANSELNQAAIDNATVTYSTLDASGRYTVTSGAVSTNFITSSVAIAGASAALFKFGAANGGTETAGTNANNPTAKTFAIDESGTPSVDIQTTAQNLVSVINQDPNNVFFTAQYTSTFSSLPGQMQFFAQNLNQGKFALSSSRSTCWSPPLPPGNTSYLSSNVTLQNGLAISNVAMPESVPPANLLPVGSPNFPIRRIIPVRTGLIVVKPEEGVFIITGTSPSTLTVTQLDTTAYIKGSETMVPLNNSGYFFTTQGVMLVNESGCEIMSRNIQGDILALAAFTNFQTLSFAVGYQSDNAYILFLQDQSTDTYSTLQYRYNWITQAWTTWDIPCTAALVNTADDKLYLATPDGYILQERKTFTNQDLADQTNQVVITSVGADTLTLTDSTGVNVGDQISQINDAIEYIAIVTENDAITGVIGVDSVTGFETGTADDTTAINSTVTFMPTSCGYPGFIKKFTTWNFEFSQVAFNNCIITFTTDFYPNSESVTLTPSITGQWGQFPWGTRPWGVTQQALQPITTYSTKNTSIGHWTNVSVNLQQAFSGFALNGYSISFNFLGERSR